MATTSFKASITDAIYESVRRKVELAFDEEMESALMRVKERRAEIVAATAMKVSKMYDIKTDQDRVIITVAEIPEIRKQR